MKGRTSLVKHPRHLPSSAAGLQFHIPCILRSTSITFNQFPLVVLSSFFRLVCHGIFLCVLPSDIPFRSPVHLLLAILIFPNIPCLYIDAAPHYFCLFSHSILYNWPTCGNTLPTLHHALFSCR